MPGRSFRPCVVPEILMVDAERLLQEAVGGNTDALAALLEEHGPAVARRLEIGRQWRGMIEAEDVMQVTYLEAFLQIHRFDRSRGVAFESWLHRIARNNLLDAVRGLSRRKQPQPRDRVREPTGDSSVGLLNLLGVVSATPSREAGRAENAQLLDRAIEQLPADYAAVIRLYDLQGKPVEEVAAAMKRSPGAVHMLRARAHDALRDQLGRESMFFSNPS
jgi:RNA polymerase sigma-70 factor, ECF subfamily